MITGVHAMNFSADAEADRAFLRDVIGLGGVDSGGGWLIFRLPPEGELGVHGGENGFHQLYFIVDDVDAFVDDLGGRNVACTEIESTGWGRITYVSLPGGGRLGFYQATHARP